MPMEFPSDKYMVRPEPSWLDAYDLSEGTKVHILLEGVAKSIRHNLSNAPSALWQVGGYTASLVGSSSPKLYTQEIVDQHTKLRGIRQSILSERIGWVSLRQINSEAALLRDVGGPVVMEDQLDSLINAMHLPGVDLRLASLTGKAYSGMAGSYTIFETDDDKYLHFETAGGDVVYRHPQIEYFETSFDNDLDVVLGPVETLKRLHYIRDFVWGYSALNSKTQAIPYQLDPIL